MEPKIQNTPPYLNKYSQLLHLTHLATHRPLWSPSTPSRHNHSKIWRRDVKHKAKTVPFLQHRTVKQMINCSTPTAVLVDGRWCQGPESVFQTVMSAVYFQRFKRYTQLCFSGLFWASCKHVIKSLCWNLWLRPKDIFLEHHRRCSLSSLEYHSVRDSLLGVFVVLNAFSCEDRLFESVPRAWAP